MLLFKYVYLEIGEREMYIFFFTPLPVIFLNANFRNADSVFWEIRVYQDNMVTVTFIAKD